MRVADGKPTKEPAVLLKPDVGSIVSQGLTTSGSLYAVKDASTVSLQVATIDLDRGELAGPPVLQIYRPQTPQTPAWSLDGKLLAYAARSASDRSYLAIREIGSNRVRELHPPLVYIPHLQWFPDARSLLVHGRDIKRRFTAMRIDTVSGEETVIVSGVMERVQITPDGLKAYYTVGDGGNSRAGTVMEHDIATGARREVFRKPEGTGSTHLSPDGKLIVVIRTPPIDSKKAGPAGMSTLFVHAIDGGPSREINLPGALSPFFAVDWTPDGKAILVPGGSPEGLWLVPVMSGAPRRLDIDIRRWHPSSGIKIHPNAKQIAYFTGETGRELWALENVTPLSK